MEVFLPILSQTILLMLFVLLGFVFAKWKLVPDNTAVGLSKLETLLFLPALMLGTFLKNFTVERFASVGTVFLSGLAMGLLLIPLSIFFGRLCFGEDFLRKICIYGLAFANFGYMGNAVMTAVYPEIFFEYTMFTLPLWILIYLWGVPVLLVGTADGVGKQSLKSRLKAFLNPMLVAMLVGAILGLTGIKLPSVVTSAVEVAGNCMSPIAMLLTGMTVAKLSVSEIFKSSGVYLLSVFKLVVYPLLYIAVAFVLAWFGVANETVLLCGLCVACMPTGLNSIVIPASYGKDTKKPAVMALVTHLLSVITIPLSFMLFQILVF